VTGTINSNFNGTIISPGNFIWFNLNFKASGIPSTGAQVNFTNASVTIMTPKNGTFMYAIPDGQINFSPSATCATTMFNGTTWVTTVPVTGSDEILLSALGIQVPVDFKASNITLTGQFTASTGGISISWKAGAAVYTTDVTQPNYNNLGVKPTHTKACLTACMPSNNSDHAGTPECVKKMVIGGARGGGGSNFTGSWTATNGVKPCAPQPQ
jgi:hypothetical protein